MKVYGKGIMVIGGTSDGRALINMLAQKKMHVLATVATSYGRELVNAGEYVRVLEQRLSDQEMIAVIKAQDIAYMLDASHPYAREVSINAIKACQATGIPYLRYERTQSLVDEEQIISVPDYPQAASLAAQMEGNVLLTTGSKTLEPFLKMGKALMDRLFLRILPDSEAIAKLERAGIGKEKIIAVKGPFSEGFNLELMKFLNVRVLVTKNSGSAGGTEEKIVAAQKLFVKTILIQRPDLEYPEKVDTLMDAVYKIEKFFDSENVMGRGDAIWD